MSNDRYELSNEDLDKAFSDYPSYGGCFPKDTLPKPTNKFYVINLDNHTGGGTHWVLLYNCHPTDVVYFDSYGEPPPEQVMTWMHKSGKSHVQMNQQEIQSLGTPWCGYYCMAAAEHLQSGETLQQFVDLFDLNPTVNDKRIAPQAKQVFKQLKKAT